MLLSIFKYLWRGTDNVTRLSTINEYENGGMKMIDQESMIKSLRLALLKRIFGANEDAWKSYLQVSLEHFVSLLLFQCNFGAKNNLSLLNSIPSCFTGGLNFTIVLILKRSGQTYCGTTKRKVWIDSLSFTKRHLKRTLLRQTTFFLIWILLALLQYSPKRSVK